MQVGDFRVERRALDGEPLQHRLAVLALEQRAGAVARQPCQLRGHLGMQVDHEPARAQQAPVAGIQHRAAAGGDDAAGPRQQFGEQGAFARAEAGFALAVEDRRHAGARMRLDLAVRVRERQAEPLGQPPADGGLAGAHGADQHEVGRRIHAPRS